MSNELEKEAQLEIGHVLFIDIVAFSKLMVDEQSAATQRLNQIVRSTEPYRAEEAAGTLIRLPTGDGVLLVFFSSPEAPARCAVEISRALKTESFGVRMGIHSGPIHKLRDLDDRANLAGTGVNMAQRVMDCGDAGHILLSRRIAEDLEHHSKWRPRLHHLGTFEVKHGAKIDIVSLHDGDVGNAALPGKLKGKRVAATSSKKWLILGAAAIVVVIVSITGWLVSERRNAASAVSVPEKSVAILPFRPISSQNRDETLENGMADTLIAKLSTVSQIVIPSLTSAQKFLEQEHDPVAAARLLHVRAVLDGTLQKASDRIRVTVRLINVADGASLWSNTFDEKFTDVFTVEDTIAQRVATALALHLNADQQQRMTKRYTQNAEAYQLYLRGRFYWNKYTEEGFRRSIEFYNQAIALDPNYALAYAGLADTYIQLSELNFAPPTEYFPKAKAYAAKALALEDNLPQSHVAMGTYLLFYEWNWAEAEKELKRGIELNPSYPDARHFYNHYLEIQGRLNEAIAEIKRGLELDPLSLIINNEVAWAYYHAKRYDLALQQIRKTADMDPSFFLSYQIMAQVYEMSGNPQAAIEILQKQLAPSGNWSWLVAELGCAYAAAGDKPRALDVIEELKKRSTTEFIDPYLVATIYVHLDDTDAAFAWLDKAIAERSTNVPWCNVEPKFDRLRSDPRFDDLLRKMNLQKETR